MKPVFGILIFFYLVFDLAEAFFSFFFMKPGIHVSLFSAN